MGNSKSNNNISSNESICEVNKQLITKIHVLLDIIDIPELERMSSSRRLIKINKYLRKLRKYINLYTQKTTIQNIHRQPYVTEKYIWSHNSNKRKIVFTDEIDSKDHTTIYFPMSIMFYMIETYSNIYKGYCLTVNNETNEIMKSGLYICNNCGESHNKCKGLCDICKDVLDKSYERLSDVHLSKDTNKMLTLKATTGIALSDMDPEMVDIMQLQLCDTKSNVKITTNLDTNFNIPSISKTIKYIDDDSYFVNKKLFKELIYIICNRSYIYNETALGLEIITLPYRCNLCNRVTSENIGLCTVCFRQYVDLKRKHGELEVLYLRSVR